MKVLHMIGGGDVGGAKTHVLSLVKNLGKHIDVKMISFRPGAFTDDARSMGIDVEVVKTGSFFSDLHKVLKIVRQGNFDIIHSHGAKANMFAVAVKLLTKLPTVTTVHSDYKLDYLQSIYKKYSFGLINTVALRFIDYYINVSKNLKELLIKRKFNSKNIFMVPNGIDFNKPFEGYSRENFSKKFNLNLNESDVVVGILARLTPVKGLSTFLLAAREVLDKNPSIKFLIGGDGEERKSLERKAALLGISDSVYFLGFVNEPYEFMRSIDINVLTSISEGFPYVILEGAVFKKATISSDVGGISDLIESGVNGYLFTPGDYKKLAEHILELAHDSRKRKELGERIYEKSKAMYSLESMCKSQLDIYRIVLEQKSRMHSNDVIISGYYGFNNSGDDAILMAIIDNLRICRNDIGIVVLSKRPAETRKIYGVDSINRLSLFKIMRLMKNSKLFISGGGNLVQDDTSTRSLVYYLGAIWLAKLMGTKVMIYANGIGPINKKFNKMITRWILNKVDVITLREELSRHELEALHIDRPKTIVTADPALTVSAAGSSEIDEIFKNEGISAKGPFVGFSVRRCENHIKFDEKIIARAADYMIEKYGVKPVFIPMQHPNDIPVIQSIISQMSGKGLYLKNPYNVASILGVISRMEMIVGMRLHSLIYAASLGIPVVGLVYDPKVEAFLQYFHQASAGHIRNLDFETLKAKIDDVWNNRVEIKKDLMNITQKLKEKAFENAKIAVEMIEE